MIAQTSAVNTDAESGNLMEITVFDGKTVAQATAFPSQRVREEGRKEMFYLTTHSIHFIYGYMVSGIW